MYFNIIPDRIEYRSVQGERQDQPSVVAFLVWAVRQETVVGCRRFRNDTVQNRFARMVGQYVFKLRVQGVHGARQMFEEKTPRSFKIYCTVDPGRFARSL